MSARPGLSDALPLVEVVPFPKWRLARDQACALLLSGENLLLVTGPSGTGKTLLLEDSARVLRSIGWQVSFYVPGTPFERDVAGDGEPKVLLVDDAERLSEADLLFLRFSKHGPVVLAGSQALEQSCPNCTTIKLRPLDLKGATAFIKLWCAQAGESEPPLDEAAVLRLLSLSAGVPRLLAILLGAGTWRGEAARAATAVSPKVEESMGPGTLPPLSRPETAASFGPGQPRVAEASAMPIASEATTKTPRPHRRRSLIGRLGLAVLLCLGGFMAARYDWRLPGVLRQGADQLWAYTLPLVSSAQRQFDRITAPAVKPSPVPSTETRTAEPTPVRVPEPHVVPAPAATASLPNAAVEPQTSSPPLPSIAAARPAEPTPLRIPEPRVVPAPAATASLPNAAVEPQANSQPLPPPVAAAPSAPAEPTPPPVIVPPAVVATAAPPAIEELSPTIVETLLRRGTEMMSLGDYSAARLLFARAAKSGNVAAVLSLGRTYDPGQLTGAGTAAAVDREAARRWYRQAQAAGSQEATDLLRAMDQENPK